METRKPAAKAKLAASSVKSGWRKNGFELSPIRKKRYELEKKELLGRVIAKEDKSQG